MKLFENIQFKKLIANLPQVGSVTWIGVRPFRDKKMQVLKSVDAIKDKGLSGDHYNGKLGSKRQITLIQAEHIDAVASFMRSDNLNPDLLRRNLVVKGINLLALKGQTFSVGEVILEYTGECRPCSKMEENLGPGGYNAMRGHGGITARVLKGGTIQLNDSVKVQP